MPPDLAAQGVIWKPLEAAMAEHADLFRQHFMAQEASSVRKKFAALHRAHVRTGTFLYVPKNVEVALPLEVFHWLSGEGEFDLPAHAHHRRGGQQGDARRLL